MSHSLSKILNVNEWFTRASQNTCRYAESCLMNTILPSKLFREFVLGMLKKRKPKLCGFPLLLNIFSQIPQESPLYSWRFPTLVGALGIYSPCWRLWKDVVYTISILGRTSSADLCGEGSRSEWWVPHPFGLQHHSGHTLVSQEHKNCDYICKPLTPPFKHL